MLEHVEVPVREKLAVAVPVNELVAVAENEGVRVPDDVTVAVVEELCPTLTVLVDEVVGFGVCETDASYFQLKVNIRLSIAVTGSIDWTVT